MATHVKVLGIIHIVFGALGVIGAIIILAVFGGLAGLVGTSAESGAGVAVPLLGGIGGLIFLLILAISLPGLVVGIGLVEFRSWARVAGVVLSAIHLINIPFGTALGVYGLWALTNPETEQLFARPLVQGY